LYCEEWKWKEKEKRE
jgi:hypothetical protein